MCRRAPKADGSRTGAVLNVAPSPFFRYASSRCRDPEFLELRLDSPLGRMCGAADDKLNSARHERCTQIGIEMCEHKVVRRAVVEPSGVDAAAELHVTVGCRVGSSRVTAKGRGR